MRLNGVHVANVTFFTEGGKVDLPAIEKHLNWLADQGVHGFVPCGTTGEGATLDQEEWRVVIQTTVAVAKNRGCLVTAGCGSNKTQTVIEMCQQAKQLGADAALVVTPYYNKPTQAGLLAHYKAIATDGGLPIVLYNVPGRTSVSLQTRTIRELWALPQIVAIKEASGSYGFWMELAHELKLSEKALLAGDDDAVAFVEALGGCGVISASANVAPRVFVALHALCQQGKWQEAFALQTAVLPLVRAMFWETNPAPAKYALSRILKTSERLRLPLVPVQEETRKVIDQAISGLEKMP